MIDVHAEVQFYPDLLNTGFSEFHHLLNFLIGPFNLPEKSVIMYPNFSNFNFWITPFFEDIFQVHPSVNS